MKPETELLERDLYKDQNILPWNANAEFINDSTQR